MDKIQTDLLTRGELITAKRQIARRYFANRAPADAPRLIYVTGMAGAGKTTFIQNHQVLKAATDEGILINFDDLRVFHPRYVNHVRCDARTAAEKTDRATEVLINWLIDAATEKGFNIVLDDAAMGADITRDILNVFITKGYRIDAYALATPVKTAAQDIEWRFRQGLRAAARDRSILPRYVNMAEQSMAVENFISTVKELENNRNLSSLAVFNRAAQRLNVTETARTAAEKETQRPLNKAERATYRRRAKQLAK